MRVETYFHEGEGYDPFLIRKGWQVAQLNYLPTHGLDDLIDVERHPATDEVFILVKGTAVLLTTDDDFDQVEYHKLQIGVTYNVPTGVWHNIAMSRDAQIMIVERDNTHLNDCEHHLLTAEQLRTIHRRIAQLVDCEKL